MESRHIKINHDEALHAREQILSMELNLLNTFKRIKSYRLLRKRESTERNKLKLGLKALKKTINDLDFDMPKDSNDEIDIKRKKIKKIEGEERKDIQKELDEIQRKLARLK